MNFDDAFTRLLGNEGGYANYSDDPGGETNWGITVAVARKNGYAGPMALLPKNIAQAIYQTQYWSPAHCDQLPGDLAFEVFDAAVNSGVDQAIKWLQQSIGVVADGNFGQKTLAAVQSSNPDQAAARLCGYRLKFMTELGTWPTFGRGWAARIANNLIKAGT